MDQPVGLFEAQILSMCRAQLIRTIKDRAQNWLKLVFYVNIFISWLSFRDTRCWWGDISLPGVRKGAQVWVLQQEDEECKKCKKCKKNKQATLILAHISQAFSVFVFLQSLCCNSTLFQPKCYIFDILWQQTVYPEPQSVHVPSLWGSQDRTCLDEVFFLCMLEF